MSTSHDDLAVRKQLLVAQSALYRAQLKYDVSVLRSRATRASNWIGGAITLISLARTAVKLLSFLRK